MIGATSLGGRIDEAGGPAAKGGSGQSLQFECLDDAVTTRMLTKSRPAMSRKLAPGGRPIARSADSPIPAATAGAPEMRAMAELRASEFVFGVKAELHGRSSLNAPNLANFLGPGQPTL